MRKKIIFICLILFSAFSLNAQRKAKTITIDIKPVNGQGFNGTLDLMYAFENCFGDINMLFTYNNVKINSFSYGGRTFTARDLGIDSFDEYLIVPDIYLNSILEPAYFKDGRPRYGGIDGGIQKTIKSNIKLDNVLDKQLAGCYGQTLNLRSLKGVKYKYLYVASSKNNYADFSWNVSLSEIAKCKIEPDCDIETLIKNKESTFLKNNRYEVSIRNENRHRDPRFNNTNNEYGTMVVKFEVFCENPKKLIPKLKDYAHNLFSKVDKYRCNRLVLGASNQNYFAENIRIESSESQEYSIIKLSNDNPIMPFDVVNMNSYLNSNVENNVVFDGKGSFYVTDFIKNCGFNNYNTKARNDKKKSYWKN